MSELSKKLSVMNNTATLVASKSEKLFWILLFFLKKIRYFASGFLKNFPWTVILNNEPLHRCFRAINNSSTGLG